MLTVVLYLLCVSVLVVPLLLAFAHADEEGLIRDFYLWIVPLLVLVQVVLLLVPIDVARERPVKRRSVVLAAVMGAMPLALLTLCFVGATALMGLGEGAVRDYLYSWPALVFVLISWLVWGVVFYRSTLTKDPAAFNKSLTRWLLGGSILELLVAIPSHIVSRHRDECCAPPFSLLAIATGLAIALLSFGPGVFFLFARRIGSKTANGRQRPSARTGQ